MSENNDGWIDEDDLKLGQGTSVPVSGRETPVRTAASTPIGLEPWELNSVKYVSADVVLDPGWVVRGYSTVSSQKSAVDSGADEAWEAAARGLAQGWVDDLGGSWVQETSTPDRAGASGRHEDYFKSRRAEAVIDRWEQVARTQLQVQRLRQAAALAPLLPALQALVPLADPQSNETPVPSDEGALPLPKAFSDSVLSFPPFRVLSAVRVPLERLPGRRESGRVQIHTSTIKAVGEGAASAARARGARGGALCRVRAPRAGRRGPPGDRV